MYLIIIITLLTLLFNIITTIPKLIVRTINLQLLLFIVRMSEIFDVVL